MPLYEFRAIDGAGQAQAGVMDAPNPNEIVRQLASRGLKVQHVKPAPQAAPDPAFLTATAQPAYRAPTPSSSYTPVPRPAPSPTVAAQSVYQVPPHPGLEPVCPVKTATEKDTYFLFAQLSNLFRSGINPAQVMDDMANRTRKKGWAEAFRHIARLVSQGTALSVAMSVYEGIFAPGAVGAVAAGEAGGYLWQACEQVSEQAKSAMRLKAVYNWVSAIFWSSILPLPLIGVARASIDSGIAAINHPEQSAVASMGSSALKELFGVWGFLTVAGVVAYFWLRHRLAQPKYKAMRDATCVKVPMLKQRTEAANAEAFAMHLQHLGNAGISPHRAWAFAAKAVPNTFLSNELMAQTPAMSEQAKLSDGFLKSRLFPEEFGHLLQTGEMTGQMGRALEDSRQMSHHKLQSFQAMLIVKGLLWIGLIMFASSALTGAIVMRGFYDSAFKHVLEDGSGQSP